MESFVDIFGSTGVSRGHRLSFGSDSKESPAEEKLLQKGGPDHETSGITPKRDCIITLIMSSLFALYLGYLLLNLNWSTLSFGQFLLFYIITSTLVLNFGTLIVINFGNYVLKEWMRCDIYVRVVHYILSIVCSVVISILDQFLKKFSPGISNYQSGALLLEIIILTLNCVLNIAQIYRVVCSEQPLVSFSINVTVVLQAWLIVLLLIVKCTYLQNNSDYLLIACLLYIVVAVLWLVRRWTKKPPLRVLTEAMPLAVLTVNMEPGLMENHA